MLDSLRGLGVLSLTGHREEEMIITPEVELVVIRQSEIQDGSRMTNQESQRERREVVATFLISAQDKWWTHAPASGHRHELSVIVLTPTGSRLWFEQD